MSLSANNLFCEVLLPLPLPSTYTYRVPREWVKDVFVGQRVVVSLGRKKLYCGLVYELHSRPPKVQSVKYLFSLLDTQPIVSQKTLKFWNWLSEYYMCYMGDVMACALPSSLRLKSESVIIINPDFDGDITNATDTERSVLDVIANKNEAAISDIMKATGEEKIMPLLSRMIKSGYIVTQEEYKDHYRPKIEQYISLTEEYQNEKKLQELFSVLEKDGRKKKQYETLMLFFQCAKGEKNFVSKTDMALQSKFSASAFQSLVKAGVFCIRKQNISRLKKREQTANINDIVLSCEQQKAIDKITTKWDSTPVSLLWGVTGSGKTAIYLKLIDKVIQEGGQVLFLLPEIALTITFIQRLEKYFGNRIGVYHSRFSKEERAEIFNKVCSINRKERYDVVIGARSAVFLPFTDLKLVIVDEENDPSFKQYDPAPRYNARDCAIYLASLHKAKTILGSATPSVETFFNAKEDKYQLIELKNRYFDVPLPEIVVADLRSETIAGTMKGEFSSLLTKSIEEALKNHQQVLLFQNRRGFSRSIRCEACGGIIHCTNCDVALTYHKQSNDMRCHYCGQSIQVPEKCPDCGSYNLKMIGFGTEKIEEMLQILFPEANSARLDLDTTKNKRTYQKIITAFQNHEIDILVGTQMITKGLDFSNVALVAVMDADGLMFFPDFRSTERAFSQMIQVAGRAGRHHGQGKVIIQTRNPENKTLKDVVEHSYIAMYEKQILERRVFKYPPYYRLIKISVQSIQQGIAQSVAEEFASNLRKIYGGRVLGAQEPLISRIKNRYLMDIMMKVERGASIRSVKTQIRELSEKTRSRYSQIRIAIDVDPI